MAMELRGVDGRNLLAFLATVGTLAALDQKAALIARLFGTSRRGRAACGAEVKSIRLSWHADTFRPTIHLPLLEQTTPVANTYYPALEDCVIRILQRGLKKLSKIDDILPWKNIKEVSRKDFREHALLTTVAEVRSHSDRSQADFVAGLASDAAGSEKEIEYTALCVITGDSHQHFLGFMRDLRKQVTAEHLRSALFAPWKYKEQGRAFRWDPGEDRRYALRASDPAKGRDKEIPSMWGANRLAFEALACFPCFPKGRHLRTTAFEDERIVRWPLWTPAVDLPTLRSLIAHPAVVDRDARLLGAMGVFAIASSRRTPLGRKRTFGPASLWSVPM